MAERWPQAAGAGGRQGSRALCGASVPGRETSNVFHRLALGVVVSHPPAEAHLVTVLCATMTLQTLTRNRGSSTTSS